MNNFIQQIIPILLAAMVAIITVVIKTVGDITVKYISAKKEETILKIGRAEYEKRFEVAKDIWNIVDEHFRVYEIVEDSITEKANMFNSLLLRRIPTLTQSDLDYLRQSIAGEINRGKEVIAPEMEGMLD